MQKGFDQLLLLYKIRKNYKRLFVICKNGRMWQAFNSHIFQYLESYCLIALTKVDTFKKGHSFDDIFIDLMFCIKKLLRSYILFSLLK